MKAHTQTCKKGIETYKSTTLHIFGEKKLYISILPLLLETKHLTAIQTAQGLLISKNILSVEAPLSGVCKHKKIIPVMLLRLLNLPNGTHSQQIPVSAAPSVVRIINTTQSF